MKDKEKEIIIKSPHISESTQREMTKFFWKTSIPRILKERAKNKQDYEDEKP